MRVEGRELLGVANLHRQAVLEQAALVLDDAVGRGIDRLADARFEIDAVVKAAARQAAVIAPGSERRGNARARLGQAQSGIQPPAALVEPAFGFVIRREPPEGLFTIIALDRDVDRSGDTVLADTLADGHDVGHARDILEEGEQFAVGRIVGTVMRQARPRYAVHLDRQGGRRAGLAGLHLAVEMTVVGNLYARLRCAGRQQDA